MNLFDFVVIISIFLFIVYKIVGIFFESLLYFYSTVGALSKFIYNTIGNLFRAFSQVLKFLLKVLVCIAIIGIFNILIQKYTYSNNNEEVKEIKEPILRIIKDTLSKSHIAQICSELVVKSFETITLLCTTVIEYIPNKEYLYQSKDTWQIRIQNSLKAFF